ncbi:hypothetical protein LshimejAT787_0703810 [Lyophyllum shimeji]|uniref:Uncharacterized protein n=1 Tax=Lyophyllum shimeji TaxID=47721 RepID=A0A9P3PR71_LYOSH|nr:hypothetical protein LshimejAT787_0703810 [Lyophyllum shimeji]
MHKRSHVPHSSQTRTYTATPGLPRVINRLSSTPTLEVQSCLRTRRSLLPPGPLSRPGLPRRSGSLRGRQASATLDKRASAHERLLGVGWHQDIGQRLDLDPVDTDQALGEINALEQ